MPEPDPFCGAPVWNLAYHEVINCDRSVYYAASEGAALLFGLAQSLTGEYLLLPLEDSWFYGRPLLGADAADLLVYALPELAAKCAPEQPVLLLSGILPGSPLARRLLRVLPAGWALYRYGKTSQRSASLVDGLDGWLGRRSASLRRSLRRSMKKALDAGIQFERVRPGPEHVDAVYGRMLRIEAESWKGVGCCGMGESPSREFYHEMLRLLAPARDALIIFATRGDEDAGFIFGGLAGGYYRGQQFSYALKWGSLSPGNLMQQEKVRWLCELGMGRYDMGPAVGPRMEYKHHWTETGQEFQTWLMRREN